MDIFENIINSFASIWSNKLRSGLTMLGIIIGVSSVVVMVAIGTGAQQGITSRLQQMGTNVLFVSPGGGSDIRTVFRGGGSGTLKNSDFQALEGMDGVRGISPELSGNKQGIYKNNNTRIRLIGVQPEYFNLKDKELIAGNFLNDEDDLKRNKNIVIDETAWEDLFGGINPIGEDIRIENSIFRVVGLIKGESGESFIPFSTAQLRVFGQKTVSQIAVFANEADEMDAIKANIEKILLAEHNINDAASADFSVLNQTELLDTINDVTAIFTILLGGIAAISLLVGGIGVMNIMLVSVMERTREIGIRKAIGAHRNDILIQFLIESVILSLLGGILGILLSFGVKRIIASATELQPIITTGSILMAFGFSAGVGIFFGLLPSYKASKLKPIDALRFE
ncbi:ABC transporter permease [Patescibacteria group bacterium]|nr:ABC transporter permease [Patescibacteria group bacterium]